MARKADPVKKVLHDTVADLDIFKYLDYRKYLGDVFHTAKTSLATLTFQDMSHVLGFTSPNFINLVIRGKRNLSAKASTSVSTRLGLKGLDKQYFKKLVHYKASSSIEEREKTLRSLIDIQRSKLIDTVEGKQIEYFSEWYIPVIKELFSVEGFRPDPILISKVVFPSITPEQAKYGLERLEQMGMIKFNFETQKFEVTNIPIKTPANLVNLCLSQYTRSAIQNAQKAFDGISADRRDISTTMVSMSSKQYEEIKSRIQRLTDQVLLEEENDENKTDVYMLNVQLFPCTQMINIESNDPSGGADDD